MPDTTPLPLPECPREDCPSTIDNWHDGAGTAFDCSRQLGRAERDALAAFAQGLQVATDSLRAERDALAAKVAALADWHETKAEKARRFRIEIDGRNPVMDKAAEVHADAARRLRAALDEEAQP